MFAAGTEAEEFGQKRPENYNFSAFMVEKRKNSL
jgi:hypothetical protein